MATSGYVLSFNLKNMEKKSFFPSLENLSYDKGGQNPELEEWMARILTEAGEQSHGYASYCKNLFSILLIHLLRSFIHVESAKIPCASKPENTYGIIDLFFKRIFGEDGHS